MYKNVNYTHVNNTILTLYSNLKSGFSKAYMRFFQVHLRIPMASDDKQNGFKVMVKEVIDQILPSAEVELTDIKDEIWQDLSALYYKYEDEDQKRAFREVMCDISDRIQEGKWDSVYKKLYRVEQKDKVF
jgi:hypothetical protein